MMNTSFFNGSKCQEGNFVPGFVERSVNSTCSKVVFFYLPKAKKHEVIDFQEVKELTFYEMLKPCYLKQLKKYLYTHRLLPSEEYQLVVTLGMEMDDELLAEKIISGYIYRHGLFSDKARQALADLGFDKALNVLDKVQKSDEDDEKEPSDAEKLRDGFLMFQDDDVADRVFVLTHFGEPA